MDNNRPKSAQKFKNVFMQQTSPNNPYGPNYYLLPYNAKLGYKFSKMKGYIKPTKQDLIKKQDEDSKFLGTLLMGFAGGALIGGIGRILFKRLLPNFNAILNYNQHIYYPIIISFTSTWSYFQAYQRYYQELYKMDSKIIKYPNEAVLYL